MREAFGGPGSLSTYLHLTYPPTYLATHPLHACILYTQFSVCDSITTVVFDSADLTIKGALKTISSRLVQTTLFFLSGAEGSFFHTKPILGGSELYLKIEELYPKMTIVRENYDTLVIYWACSPMFLPSTQGVLCHKMTSAGGHKKTGGGELGQKKCLSKVYECPIRPGTWKASWSTGSVSPCLSDLNVWKFTQKNGATMMGFYGALS